MCLSTTNRSLERAERSAFFVAMSGFSFAKTKKLLAYCYLSFPVCMCVNIFCFDTIFTHQVFFLVRQWPLSLSFLFFFVVSRDANGRSGFAGVIIGPNTTDRVLIDIWTTGTVFCKIPNITSMTNAYFILNEADIESGISTSGQHHDPICRHTSYFSHNRFDNFQ